MVLDTITITRMYQTRTKRKDTTCPSAGETQCSSLGFGAWPHHFQCHHQRVRGGARQGAMNIDLPFESHKLLAVGAILCYAFEAKFPIGDVWCMDMIYICDILIFIHCVYMCLPTLFFFEHIYIEREREMFFMLETLCLLGPMSLQSWPLACTTHWEDIGN